VDALELICGLLVFAVYVLENWPLMAKYLVLKKPVGRTKEKK